MITIPTGARLALFALWASASSAVAADWKPADGPLRTRWAKDIRPENPLPEYPRPQLVREAWKNLNGLWQFAFARPGEAAPVGKTLDGTILVPFPVESALSGVMKPVETGGLWYRRTFEVPAAWARQRVLLHFGAVDWAASVTVNGRTFPTHEGGFDPFTLDITAALEPGRGREQEIIVGVFDPTDGGTQPRGKQVKKPEGIFYTPTTGIWQTVWLEPVPSEAHISALKIVPDVDASRFLVQAKVTGLEETDLIVTTLREGSKTLRQSSAKAGAVAPVVVPQAKFWTPESPFLYDLTVELKRGGKTVDIVQSYAGLRKIEVGPRQNGYNRISLNGKPIFQVGPLDQGFWPDGLYTAPTDEALKYDIEITKQLGFNMTRKHVKVEPDRWYYWCDKLGLLVWQDMPSGDRSIGPNDPDIVRTPESARHYDTELKAMIDALHNHPSIITWVVFNEGWGQFDTRRVADWTKSYDPTRLVDATSGWADRAGAGDLHDLHNYPRPAAPPAEEKRAGVLGEFGGLSLGVDGHMWTNKIWGYQGTSSSDELTRKYERLLREGWELKESQGLNALVYTQITDVETEANGLLTYDRTVIKVDPARVARVNRGDFTGVPVTRVVVPSSEREPLRWRFTTEKPSSGWNAPGFDDASWSEGPGVLGTHSTPGANVRTVWNTPDIWARRVFTLPDVKTENLLLSVLHDEDAEIYLNGILAATVRGYTGSYEELPISPEARAALKPGVNQIAIHCHQTIGGQSIDAGLVEIQPAGK